MSDSCVIDCILMFKAYRQYNTILPFITIVLFMSPTVLCHVISNSLQLSFHKNWAAVVQPHDITGNCLFFHLFHLTECNKNIPAK